MRGRGRSKRPMAGEGVPDQCLFVLDDAQFDAFVEVLESPPKQDIKLEALLRRRRVWSSG